MNDSQERFDQLVKTLKEPWKHECRDAARAAWDTQFAFYTPKLKALEERLAKYDGILFNSNLSTEDFKEMWEILEAQVEQISTIKSALSKANQWIGDYGKHPTQCWTHINPDEPFIQCKCGLINIKLESKPQQKKESNE